MQRRSFLAMAAAATSAPWMMSGSSATAGGSPTESLQVSNAKKKIAFLGTEVRQHSHSQHFLDRHTLGYAWESGWVEPRVACASVYIDQFPEGDLAKERIARHNLKAFPTIAEALTLGTSELAVDGVVIIGEHGDYPLNEKGQRLYPRYAWFKECVKVFERCGRSVPIFNDKHLSTDWQQCLEMVADSKRLNFPFLAGSSLPVTWRFPQIDLPWGTPLQESVCVCYGGVDSYDFHGLETAQCMSERRKGGEVGIRSVHAMKDQNVWNELEKPERQETQKLFVAALSRSHNLPVEGGYPTDKVTYQWAKRALPNIIGYFIEHLDGFHTAMFLTQIRDFNYAGIRSDNGEIISCQMYLPMPGQSATTADFFTPLVRHIEEMVITNRAIYPVERTLLTSGMVIGGVESLFQGEKRYETPTMNIAYQVPNESWFRRT